MALRLPMDFLKTDAAGGAALALAALTGFVLANSPWAHLYFGVVGADFTVQLGGFSETLTVEAWIRQGLMAVFFFVVGLEIKQEVIKGELSSPRRLALPVIAAAGGMLVPALVYLAVNLGSDGAPHAWPIPTATDIAFALAAMALVGKGLPQSLRVFLLAMAIADDVGSVGLIAALYSSQIHVWPMAGAALTLIGLVALSEWRDAPFLLRLMGYLALGAFTLKSGVNTALAGVAGALTVPIGPRRPGQEAVLKHFLRTLQPYVTFGVLPLFALTAAGVSLEGVSPAQLLTPAPLGIALALVAGKQIGVLGAVWVAIRTGLARRPTGASWLELYGVAALCGAGFTFSLFLADLAFPQGGAVMTGVTLGVVAGSLTSTAYGAGVLSVAAARRRRLRPDQED